MNRFASLTQLFLLTLFTVSLAAAPGKTTIGNPIHNGRLTVFPILGPPTTGDAPYLTLDEALSQNLVTVGELGSLTPRMVRTPTNGRPVTDGTSPSVNQLALANNSDRPLLLLAGEIVTGGKQDRIVGRDRIVPPHSAPVPLDVFCVEPGRWTGMSMNFTAAKTMAHPELRKQALVEKDQSKVWAEVATSRKNMVANAPPAMAATVTAAVMDGSSYAKSAEAPAMQQVLKTSIDTIAPQLPGDALGIVVAVDGRVVWADLFPSAALFKRYRAKLLQSYVVESYSGAGAAKQATAEDAAAFLRETTGHQNIDVEPGLYRLTRAEAGATITYELENAAGLRLHFARMTRH